MDNGRHRVFNFKLSKPDPSKFNKTLKEVFEKFNCAAKTNLSFGFILRNLDTDDYRYFYAHENNTFFGKSHLLCSKGDLVSPQDRIEKMDLVETCARERANTKWRYAVTTNVTNFCALLNNIPVGCLDAVIPQQMLRRSDVNCLVTNGYRETYRDYLCLFRAEAQTCMDQLSWKETQLSCSLTFSTSLVITQLTLEECQGITLCLLKTLKKTIISFWTLTLRTGIL